MRSDLEDASNPDEFSSAQLTGVTDARRVSTQVIAAFREYETALARHDVPAINNWFLTSPRTLRADMSGVQVGWDAISEFRRRGPAAKRVVTDVHCIPLSDTSAVVMAETVRGDGNPGVQTQAWVETDDGWRIAAAHVSIHGVPSATPGGDRDSADVTAVERAIWRVTGSPLAAASPGGVLAGCTVAVKDLFAVAGHPIGLGNPTWLAEAAVETENADAVQALLNAGADITGIAQTDEFAYSLSGTNVHYGTPPNPTTADGVPGGSSSGPASAVALGQATIGLGTDTAGSIRVPSSYCGLYGFRPTHGSISTQGLVPLAPFFDTVGWMTRDATTLQRVGRVFFPVNDSVPITRLILAEDLLSLADPRVQGSLRDAAYALAARMGATLTTDSHLCDGLIDTWVDAFRTFQASQAWATHGEWLTRHPGSVEPEIAGRFEAGRDVTPEQLRQAQEVVQNARKALRAKVEPGTAVVQPAASTPPPAPGMAADAKARMRAGTLRLTCPASVAGLPALTLPATTHLDGPVGISVLGAAGSDRDLLSMAQ